MDYSAVSTQRVFSRQRQFTKNLLWGLGWRWVLNFLLCLITGLVLFDYVQQTKTNPLDESAKRVFNALTTGLILGIGLHLQASLNHIAGCVKWRFLASRRFNPKQFNCLLACESQMEVTKLMFSSGIGKISIVCFLWLLFNVAAQVILASLGLTITVALPIEFGSLKYATVPDAGLVADISYFPNQPTFPPDLALIDQEKLTANTFGYSASIYPAFPLSDLFNGKRNYIQGLYFTETNGKITWDHLFDVGRADGQLQFVGSGTTLTHRFVQTTAKCDAVNVFSHHHDHQDTVVTFQASSGQTKELRFFANASNKTAYISFGRPDDRGAEVFAFTSYLLNNGQENVALFQCRSRVSEVQSLGNHTNNLGIELSNHAAMVYAGAIGWLEVSSTVFAHDSPWNFPFESGPEAVGSQISKFAMGAITSNDVYGQSKTVQDIHVPAPNEQVRVEWLYACLILAGIPIAHLILLLLALLLASTTPMRDSGPLATAVLLKDTVSHIKHGKMLTDKEIAKSIDHDLVYTWEWPDKMSETQNDTRLLTVIPDQNVQQRTKFPTGHYD